MPLNITWSPLGKEELPTTAKWHPEPLVRGTRSILVASLVTLSLCVWTTLHLNIPPHGATMRTRLKRKIGWLLIGIVLPEYVLYVAVMQWLSAKAAHHRILTSFAKQRLQEEPVRSRWQKKWRRILLSPFVGGRDSDAQDEGSPDGPHNDDIEMGELGAPETPPPRRQNPWTIHHTYYLEMGGFAFKPSTLFTNDDSGLSSETLSAELGPRLSLTAQAVVFLSKHGPHLIPDIPETEIIDKSNADGLSRSLSIAQAVWFLLQFVARLAVGLPVTILELTVVAHIVFAVLVFFFWWNKPLDIWLPTEVPAKSPKDFSLLAAMYIRSRMGYMRRVDDYSIWTNNHAVFLDLAPVGSETEPRRQSATEGIQTTDESLSPNGHSGAVQTPMSTEPLSFKILLGQESHGIRVVAWSHTHFLKYSRLRVVLRHTPTNILGRYIMLDSDIPGCACSIFPDVVKNARVTLHYAHCGLFRLAKDCEHLDELLPARGTNQSAIRRYLETVRGQQSHSNSLDWSWRLRRDFVVEGPLDYDIEALNDIVATLVSFFFFFFLSSIFGVLHMLAWYGPFHTYAELVMWRLAASILAFPLAALVAVVGYLALASVVLLLLALAVFALMFSLMCLFPRYRLQIVIFAIKTIANYMDHQDRLLASIWSAPLRVLTSWLGNLLGMEAAANIPPAAIQHVVSKSQSAYTLSIITLFGTLFFFARFCFLVECVINITFAPPRVFELPNWVSYLPKIS